MTSGIPAPSQDPASITPVPSIHNLPAADNSNYTPPAELTQFQAWGTTLLNQVATAIVTALMGVATDAENAFSALFTFGEEVLGGVTTANQAQADLTALFEGFGASVTNATQYAAYITSLIQGLWGSASSPGVLGSIPSTAVTNTTQNLQPVFDFPDAASVSAGGQWSWDGTVDHTGIAGSGSALCVANGQLNILIGVPGPVQPGQVVTPQGFVEWSGLTATGTPIELQLIPWSGTSTPGTAGTPVVPTGCSITSPGASSTTYSGEVGGWVELTGTYTVPGSGVGFVQLALVVSAPATAGSVHFDDCTSDVAGGFLANLENDINDIIASFAPGGTAAEYVTGVQNLLALFGLSPTSIGTATNLTALWTTIVNEFINPLNAVETAATAWVTRLVNDVTILLDVFHFTYTSTQWNSAWADLMSLLGIVNSTSTPSNPTPTIGPSITAAQASATTAGTNASIAISNAAAASASTQTLQDTLVSAQNGTPVTGTTTSQVTTAYTAIPASNVVGIAPAAVAFGASSGTVTGSGSSNTTITATDTHSIATGDQSVLVAIGYSTGNNSSGAQPALSTAVTYGGTAMSQIESLDIPYLNHLGSHVQLWWLKSPPSGSETVQLSVVSTNSQQVYDLWVVAESTTASAVGTPSSSNGSGTAPSLTISSATGHLAAAIIITTATGTNSTLGSFNQTQRYNSHGTSAQGGAGTFAFGDAAGASSVTFSATTGGSSPVWGAIAVDLHN